MTLSSQTKGVRPIFWFIGVHVSSSVRKLEAALIGTPSLEPNAPITLQKSVSFDLPSEITDAFEELLAEFKKTQASSSSSSEDSQTSVKSKEADLPGASSRASSILRSTAFLRAAISSIEEEAIAETLSDSNVDKKDVVAVVVNDPVLLLNESSDNSAPFVRLSLGNASELAHKTGLNVVDSFLTRPDEPEGSAVGSLAFPYWVLLGGGERDKLLLDLGETARFTYLPSRADDQTSWNKIVVKSFAPCGSLLNALTRQTTKGGTLVDVGGKLSVQGRCSNELLSAWNEAAARSSVPFDKDVYLATLRASNMQTSSIDALCTAAYFIANRTFETIQAYASNFSSSFDLVVVGGAKQNGLLFSKLSSLFKSRPYRSLAEYGFLEDSFDAAAVATLGALFVSDIPTATSNEPKPLDKSLAGRVAPGSSENWKRFCRLCAGSVL